MGVSALRLEEDTPKRADASEIQDWIQRTIAGFLEVKLAVIDVAMPISAYGMDSVEAATLAGELEWWLGQPVPPELVSERDSAQEIAQRLARHAPSRADSDVSG